METRILRVPVLIHWSVLLAFMFSYAQTRSIAIGLAGLLAYTAMLLVHEFGHSAVAGFYRLRTHSIHLSGFHGLCTFDSPRTEGQGVAIAWGGVGAQAILAACSMLVAVGLRYFDVPVSASLSAVFFVLGPWNLLMIALNLLPIQGLDGAKAWRAFPMLWRRLTSSYRAKKIATKVISLQQERLKHDPPR